ncbi:hypothetical protein [Sphingobium sp. YR768]|uniref:hypothetical protein n=1 Tax=Sphingobium sp. YR768 TaxID=1884365 RepID=UPI0008B567CF|nr:hypothetical protein [Sphingobium sp. YR768]SES08733.1 hypothetical protein SAMN05518866_13749 [Sphingobium sp. YR768]
MTKELQYEKVEVLWANPDETGKRAWLIDVYFDDGSHIIMDDQPSHEKALVEAHSYGVPVMDCNPTLAVD